MEWIRVRDTPEELSKKYREAGGKNVNIKIF